MIITAYSIEIEPLHDPDGHAQIEITINSHQQEPFVIDISEKLACKLGFKLANILQDMEHARKSTEKEAEYHTTYNRKAENTQN